MVKKICTVILLVAGISAKAQGYREWKSFNNDTSAYLRYNFLDHKEEYIGFPVDKLIARLEIKERSFVGSFKDSGYESQFLLLFYSQERMMQISRANPKSVLGLLINYGPPVSSDSIIMLLQKHFKKKRITWDKNVDKILGRKIVKGIIKIYSTKEELENK